MTNAQRAPDEGMALAAAPDDALGVLDDLPRPSGA
jgi:hypothetical protein